MPINTKVSEKSRFQELYLLVPKTIPFGTENYTLTYRKLYPSVKDFSRKVKEFSKILPQT